MIKDIEVLIFAYLGSGSILVGFCLLHLENPSSKKLEHVETSQLFCFGNQSTGFRISICYKLLPKRSPGCRSYYLMYWLFRVHLLLLRK